MAIFGWFRSKKSIAAEIVDRSDQLTARAVTKIKAQCGYNGQGGYGYDYGSGGQKSLNGIAGNGNGIMFNHRLLRSNARKAVFDTPQAKALVQRLADTIADIGLRVEPTPNGDLLGQTMEQTEKWSEDIGERFDLFARSKLQHRSETITLYQAMHLYQKYQHRDNDLFVRLYYSNVQNLLSTLQFEFIDPDQIDGTAFTFSQGLASGNMHDGIERDSRGREKAYHVWEKDGDGHLKTKPTTIQAIGSRSKRRMMLHCFTVEYAGQGRGFSPLAHALQEFQKLTDFSQAQIQKAIAQSLFGFVVEPPDNAPATNPFDGLNTDTGIGPDNTKFGEGQIASVAGDGGNVEWKRIPEGTFSQPGGGAVGTLNAGEKLKEIKNTAPSDSFDTFVTSFTSYLSSSMSMPIEVLLMKFNANYSASRASLMMFWRTVAIWREEMATDFLNPIYEAWLSEEIAAGRVAAPGWNDPRMRAAWLKNNWVGSPMPNIDPKRTADADETYVKLGATTLDRIALNLNGSSGKKNRASNKKSIPDLTPIPDGKASSDGKSMGSGK